MIITDDIFVFNCLSFISHLLLVFTQMSKAFSDAALNTSISCNKMNTFRHYYRDICKEIQLNFVPSNNFILDPLFVAMNLLGGISFIVPYMAKKQQHLATGITLDLKASILRELHQPSVVKLLKTLDLFARSQHENVDVAGITITIVSRIC